jgi:hypothetical protein
MAVNHRDSVLLFDDQPIQSKRDVQRQMMLPERDPQPVLTPELPWEINRWAGDPGMSVLQEEDGRCHMWYMLRHEAKGEEEIPALALTGLDEKTQADLLACPRYILAYATSADGISWTKPELDLISWGGHERTNLLMAGRLGGTVFIDPNAPAESRLKMLYGGGERVPYRLPDEPESTRNVYHGIWGAESADGIHWHQLGPVLPWYTDTTNICYWDDQRQAYVAFVRRNHGMDFANGGTIVRDRCFYRAIARAETTDFRDFPTPTCILVPPEDLWSPYNTGTDYYNTAAMKYPFAPDAYFLFISFFHHRTGLLDVHLATSRDGIDYQIETEPWFSPAPGDRFDSASIYFGAGLVDHGDEFSLYYRGYSYPHSSPLVPRGSFATDDRPVGIGRVRVRRDGLFAQVFGTAGELVTRPLPVTGSQLQVNVDAGANGELRVAVLDPAGQTIPGYSLDACAPIIGNRVGTTVSWEGKSGLEDLRGRDGSLQFAGAHARLFSFAFQD